MPLMVRALVMFALMVAAAPLAAHTEDAKAEAAPVTKEDEAFQRRLFGHALAGKILGGLEACGVRIVAGKIADQPFSQFPSSAAGQRMPT